MASSYDLSHRFEAESVGRALELVGERWTLLILREAFFGVRRFGQLARNLNIPRPTLSSRLRMLVDGACSSGCPILRIPRARIPAHRHRTRSVRRDRDPDAVGRRNLPHPTALRSCCATTPAAKSPTPASRAPIAAISPQASWRSTIGGPLGCGRYSSPHRMRVTITRGDRARVGEPVLVALGIPRIGDPLDEPTSTTHPQPGRERGPRDVEVARELTEAAHPKNTCAQDEQRPALAKPLEGPADGLGFEAVRRIRGSSHGSMTIPVQLLNQSLVT